MSELSDWKQYVLPGLLADAKAEGRGEMTPEIERLRAALLPFALEANRYDNGFDPAVGPADSDEDDGERLYDSDLTIGQLRRARMAYGGWRAVATEIDTKEQS